MPRGSRRFGWVVAALIALAGARAAHAGGVNLAWGGGCYGENPVSNLTFGCDSGTLRDATIVGSFTLDRPISDFVGMEAVLDVQAESETLPAWWQFFNGGACRGTSLSASADFTSAPGSTCSDPWSGRAGGGIAAYQTATTMPSVPSGQPNMARLKIAYAVPSDGPVALTGGVEYYAFRLRIDAQRTVGAGACSGCATPVTITAVDIEAAGLSGTVEHETTALQSPCVSWQGSGASCAADQTHARNASWGRVKSFYR